MRFHLKFAHIVIILAVLLSSLPVFGREPDLSEFPVLSKPWTGDLDGMIKRRVIRVLTVYVRKGSSVHFNLERLNGGFEKAGKPPVRFSFAPEQLEDEDLLEMTNAGLIKIIVVNNFLANFWKQVFSDITLHSDIEVDKGGEIA